MNRFIAFIMTMLSSMVSCGESSRYTTLDNGGFAKTIADERTQLVDVRTAEEFAAGHIQGAVNIDIKGTDFDVISSSLDKSRPVAVYCRSGVRSRGAAERLAADGFTVYNLADGIVGWDGVTE